VYFYTILNIVPAEIPHLEKYRVWSEINIYYNTVQYHAFLQRNNSDPEILEILYM